MEPNGKLDGVDVLSIFDSFYNHYLSVCSELACKEESLKLVATQKNKLSETNSNLRDDNKCKRTIGVLAYSMWLLVLLRNIAQVYSTMQATVTECQTQLHLVCNLQDEIRLLKKDVADKEEVLLEETRQWKRSIQDLQKEMASKLEEQKLTLTNSYQIQIDKLCGSIHDLEEKVLNLQHQLQTLEKEKTAEINSLTMNYESKLNKANRQNAQYKKDQQLVVTNDVLRKKMQHMKASYENDASFLKSKIADLEQANERLRQQFEKQTYVVPSNGGPKSLWQDKRVAGNRMREKNWSLSLSK